MSQRLPCLYKILWSTEHASGELPYEYVGMDLALEAGRDWEAEMVAVDAYEAAAAREYQWEVIRIDPPILQPQDDPNPKMRKRHEHEHDRQD